MPVYSYEHTGTPCQAGAVIEVSQSMKDAPLTTCPQCGGGVRKVLSRVFISTPRGNSSLKDLGFTKLVKRDKGVYENVTAREGESRYVVADKPGTLPNLKKTITD
jgi:putative FmdB family regulatory protein